MNYLFLFTWLVAAYCCSVNATRKLEDNCSDGEESLYFQLFTDWTPEQTAYTMVCNTSNNNAQTTVWNVPTGSLTDPRSWITQAVCVDPTVTTCRLTLTDAGGDGFDDGTGYAAGWYSLSLGATTIAVAEYPTADTFSELSFCVGLVDCDTVPLEKIDTPVSSFSVPGSCPDEEQDMLVWEVLLGANPDQTSWSLDCDGDAVWNVPAGTYASADTWVSQSTCLSTTATTCTLTVAHAMGLQDTWYSLTLGAQTIGTSSSASTATEQSFCMGPFCEAPTPTCDELWLEMELDDRPLETRMEVVCSNALSWAVDGTDIAFDWIYKDDCIDSTACCQLTVSDSGGDGISSGNVYLQVNGEVVFYYDDTDSTFSEIGVSFSGSQRQEVCTAEIASGSKS